MKNIEPIMSPKSIAVVGATNTPGSVGFAVFNNLIKGEFQGILYPVNPKTRSIQSVKAYLSLSDIPDSIDLAIIIVASERVPSILEEAGKKGVKGVVVISAGFKEVGGRGIELEKIVKQIIEKHNINMIGPNCLGIINNNPNIQMNASFATRMPAYGKIAFISQSGALCTAVLDYASDKNVGFSKFISFGNKADINEVDLLYYLKDDPDTQVILMYLEDISNGREFLEIAREITWVCHKPILVIKSGSSEEGAKAASSHTGSLAGSDKAYDAIFRQSGIIRVEGISELFNYAIALSTQPVPKGNRIAIVTNAGGPGIMATDSIIRHNMKLAKLSDETTDQLKKFLPRTASLRNPVDMIGDANKDRYEFTLKQIIKDPNVDSVIVIFSPQALTNGLETAEIIPKVTQGFEKPVLCSFMGSAALADAIKYLESNGYPNYLFPEEAVRTIDTMVQVSDNLIKRNRNIKQMDCDKDKATNIIKHHLTDRDSLFLPQKDANEILECYNFPTLKSILVLTKNDLDNALSDIGFPVAMKICSPQVIHKFDVGGVRLKIRNNEEAKEAFDSIIENVKKCKPDAFIKGILVEKMAKAGVEVILGAIKDPKFGPMCMLGLGGTFVEAIKDVTFRLAPMWESSAEKMISTLKLYHVLKGIRGSSPSDINSIKDCILRLSQMVTEHPEITELDINPLIVYPEGQGCVVADSRILLKKV